MSDPIYDSLKAMAAGLLGQRLPGERALAESLRVPRPHIRAALALLDAEGVVDRRHGSGTYAVDRTASPETLRRVLLLIDPTLKLGDDPFFSLVVDRLQEELQTRGVQCLLARASIHQDDHSGVDGVITLGLAGFQILSRWRPHQPPVVGLFIDAPHPPRRAASTLQLDDEPAGRMAAERLIEAGCGSVLFFGRESIPMVQHRRKGAADVLSGAGIPLQLVECSLNYAAGINCLRLTPLPDYGAFGVIAANDWLAVGIHAGLLARGADVTSRAHLVSFDGLPLAAEPSLNIASLVVPIDSIVQDAIEEIQRLRRPQTSPRSIRYQLQWRSADSVTC